MRLSYSNIKWLMYLLSYFPDIEDLPPTVQEKLFDEVLDRDVQKGKCSEDSYGLSLLFIRE